MPPQCKRHGISIAQHLALCTYAQKHPQLTQIQLQQWFKSKFQHLLTQPTISESLSAKYTHLDAQSLDKSTLPTTCQCQKSVKYPELEDALFEWHQQLQKDVPLSGEAIQAQARHFWYWLAPYQDMEVPQFSSGWLHKFKSRYNIRQRVYHGEASSVDDNIVNEQMKAIQALAQQFHPQDIYNCDKTDLFWKSTPDWGLASQQISGTKKYKTRITAHFCCNADESHKLLIWFIDKSAYPCCFRAAKVNIAVLDCVYKSNPAAWMTSDLMIFWLCWFLRSIGERQVLLLMDNFSAHTLAIDLISQQNHL